MVQHAGLLEMSFRVPSYDVDADGQAAPAALLRYFQEAAATHATQWNLGEPELAAKGQLWVLARLAVEFGPLPAWGEQVTVTTWSRGPERLFAFRDFEIRAADHHAVARGTSGWLVLDRTSRRPQRITAEGLTIPHYPDRHALAADAISEAMPGPDTPDVLAERTAQFSDLDKNGHVNNTKYVEWMIDALGPVMWHVRRVRSLVINYLAEVACGESVRVQTGPHRQFFALVAKDGKHACRASISTVPR